MRIILANGDIDATREWVGVELDDVCRILRGEWADCPPDRAVRKTAREAIDLIRSSGSHAVDVAVSGRLSPVDAAHLAWWAEHRTDVEIIDAGRDGSVWRSMREEVHRYARWAEAIAVRHLSGSLTTAIEDRAAATLRDIRSVVDAVRC